MASAAVQSEWMAGLCLPLTTSCLPTALILHRGHWSGSYWFLLFLSFRLFFSLSISVCLSVSDLSALAKKIKLEAMASYHSNQHHGGPNGENGDHNHSLGESSRQTHTHTRVGECEMFNYSRMTRRAGCCLYTFCDAKSTQLKQLCLCAAAEASWLKPGCDITSAACVFPPRGCERIKTNCSSDESVSSDGIRKKTSGAGNPNPQSIRSRCFCLPFLFYRFHVFHDKKLIIYVSFWLVGGGTLWHVGHPLHGLNGLLTDH